ncbi:pentapeptide repeat-containing protein [uncultured Enterovirga sp.]|uniref:pentapeptide repeat-containing protein n=1 Tax=uncultured Enterovirga sp. TaxID=2026352 RepID=UPI0035CBE378
MFRFRDRASAQRRHHAWYGLAAAVVALSVAGPAGAACGDAIGPKVDWTGCSKRQLLLSGNDLSGAVMTKAMLTSTDFRKTKFVGATLREADVTFARFDDSDLTGADLTKVVGWQTSFRNATLVKAQLPTAQMSRATFTDARMSEVSLTKSELNRSDFSGADLTGADISKAELSRVNFSKAKLKSVDFGFSNLARAKFDNVDLADAKLAGAYLFLTEFDGADLTKVTGLKQEQLDLACGTKDTKLPPGLKPPKTWPCPDDD